MSDEGGGSNGAVPTWVPDKEAPACMECSRNFSLAVRRHHCRKCGGVFCGKCSGNKTVLPELGSALQRVCIKCFNKILKQEDGKWKEEQRRKQHEEQKEETKKRLDNEYVTGIYDTPGLVVAILRHLHGGCNLGLLDDTGENQPSKVWLSSQPASLCWSRAEAQTDTIPINRMESIVLGQFSKEFKATKGRFKSAQYISFTINFTTPSHNGVKCLNVVANTLIDFEAWILGLASILRVTPPWGSPLKIEKEKHVSELTPYERQYLARNHITPTLFLNTKEALKERAAEIKHQMWVFDGDMEKVWKAVGGLRQPMVNREGALLITKGELRHQTGLDIFRTCALWEIYKSQNIVYDPNYRPSTGPGSEDYRTAILKSKGDQEERRVDVSDGRAYTKEEFVAHYGGTKEWEKSEPAPGSRKHRKEKEVDEAKVEVIDKVLYFHTDAMTAAALVALVMGNDSAAKQARKRGKKTAGFTVAGAIAVSLVAGYEAKRAARKKRRAEQQYEEVVAEQAGEEDVDPEVAKALRSRGRAVRRSALAAAVAILSSVDSELYE